MRIKYMDDPKKFMESEVELNNIIQEMHVIAAQPDLYSVFVKLGGIRMLIQLLAHENTDIVAAVCNLLQELTDFESLNESEEGTEALMDELLRLEIIGTLVQQTIGKLNEQIAEEAEAVHDALSIVENVSFTHI